MGSKLKILQTVKGTFGALFVVCAIILGSASVITTVANFTSTPKASAAASTNLNFQARLLSNTGSVVADGYYNIEFNLYDVATGGTAIWTETRDYNSNSPDRRVRVVNGYLTVNLGSVSTFVGTNIDWSQEKWLTMKVGGSGTVPAWDAEMLGTGSSRMKLTAVPEAFHAQKADTSTTLSKTDGSNDAVLNFATPTADTTFTLQAAAAGSYTVCTSVGEAACVSAYGGSNTSGFIDDGTLVRLQTATDKVTLGSATDLSAQLAIDGNSDQIQMKVQGHSTQTSFLLVLEQGNATDGTDVLTVSNAGDLVLAGTLTAAGNVTFQSGTATFGTTGQLGSVVISDGSSNTTTLRASSTSSNLTFTFPSGNGSQDDCLKGDGSGQLSWGACLSGGVQLAPSAVQSASSANTLIRLNQTGAGSLLQLQADTADMLTVTKTGTLTIGGATPFLTAGSTGTNIKTGSATAFVVQNASSKDVLAVNTTAASVLLGHAGTAGLNGTLVFNSTTANSYAATVTVGALTASYTLTLPTAVGSTGNCLKALDNSGAMTWGSCAAGGNNRVTLNPEYAGAVLYGDGTNNLGAMTADYDVTNRRAYYEWTSSQSSLQDYDIFTSYTLPSNFVSMTANSFNLYLHGSSINTTDNDVTVKVTDASNTTCYNSSVVGTITASTWAEKNFTISGCTFAADDTITIRITVSARNNNTIRLGPLRFTYSN